MVYMNNISRKIMTMTTVGLLCAVGILIPQIMPRITIGPATFTLASHVAIILAMFISPVAGIIVALITTLGFFMAGLPIVVVFRALSHVVFITVGAVILKKKPNIMNSMIPIALFAILISVIHAFGEVIVTSFLLFPGTLTKSYLIFVWGFVGVGTFIHSLIDFSLAVIIWIPVQRFVNIPANAKIKLQQKPTAIKINTK